MTCAYRETERHLVACVLLWCAVGLVELSLASTDADRLFNAANLNKCISAHLWENSNLITKQLPGIGKKNASAFVNAGIHTFKKIRELHPREVEMV